MCTLQNNSISHKIMFAFMETFVCLCENLYNMENDFSVSFLEGVDEFFKQITPKAKRKILYNIDKAKKTERPYFIQKIK